MSSALPCGHDVFERPPWRMRAWRSAYPSLSTFADLDEGNPVMRAMGPEAFQKFNQQRAALITSNESAVYSLVRGQLRRSRPADVVHGFHSGLPRQPALPERVLKSNDFRPLLLVPSASRVA
jgi:hypothetical protein